MHFNAAVNITFKVWDYNHTTPEIVHSWDLWIEGIGGRESIVHFFDTWEALVLWVDGTINPDAPEISLDISLDEGANNA